MGVRRDLLLWFLLLYGMLYCSFGLSSPFLPDFLNTRGIGAEWLGFLLGAGTAVRLLSAPFAGRLADVFGAFRLELALFAIAAAVASLLYLPAHSFWLLALVNLTQAAMLAPLVPLTDALALSWSRSTTRGNSGAFEYGWVRGTGSAAFIAGVLVAGQSAAVWGLPSVLWLTAAGLFATALSTRFVPDLAPGTNSTIQKRKVTEGDWLVLLRQPVFVRMVLAAALVIGSHAMHDAFAIIRWRDAGISPVVSSVLWSESVGAERDQIAPLLAAGMSMRAISAETGIPVGAVHRAKHQLEKTVAEGKQQAAAVSLNLPTSYLVKQNINGVTYDVRRLTIAVNERAVESAIGRRLLARGDRDTPWTVVSALFASMFDDHTIEWLNKRGYLRWDERCRAEAIIAAVNALIWRHG